MATKTITHFVDDLDGSQENVETVKFGLFGATYEVDLSKDNQSKLEEALGPFLNVARKAGGSASARRGVARRLLAARAMTRRPCVRGLRPTT